MVRNRDHRAVGKYIELPHMGTFGHANQPLGMKHGVHYGRRRALLLARKQQREAFGILAPAFETRPVSGGESYHLIEEEQLGVAIAPHGAMAIVEFELAANPLLRCPAPSAEFLAIIVQPPATIAHQCPVCGRGEQFAEG